jgi:two-component system, OmpR family, response regulator RegX3
VSQRILLVDDERPILDLLCLVLEREGFRDVVRAETAAEALELAAAAPTALIVLDVMLPDGDGFTLAPKLRKLTSAPILFLTARSLDIDKLTGFSVGGDDYVTKPFNPLEVVARIKAHLRRTAGLAPEAPAVFDCGRFRLLEDEGRLEVDGADVPMPAREFKLLAYLCRNRGRVLSKRQLYREVWGEEPLGEADDNTVQVHVRRLRERIEADPSDPKLLLTVRGLGYRLAAPDGAGQ